MPARKSLKIPKHLKRYLVHQNPKRYTPKDHAVWRFIMRELTTFLYKNAHPSYKKGIQATGITLDRIPTLSHMDKCLKKLGWRAAGISGFIPPAAFMELQALGILPIATEMRRVENLDYTPAPDIVHEAAGHAPMLANKEYSKYLRNYTVVASKAIITRKDLNQYDAIRELSDLKEHPQATAKDVALANQKLQQASAAIQEPTEAVMLARMGWWSTEYGLIGNPPKIYGAGLLSSAGESRVCLDPRVRKIPFSIACTTFGYDITDPQPQLFVAKDFKDLKQGLAQLADQMAFRRGGVFGLERMLQAETVNTIELDSGLQISGVLKDFKQSNGQAFFLRLAEPCQLSANGRELAGHGKRSHPEGFSSPIGLLKGQSKCLSLMTKSELKGLGLVAGQHTQLEYQSGITLQGKIKSLTYHKGRLILLKLTHVLSRLGDEVLYDPSWGQMDLAIGNQIPSVFGGPADREKYGPTEDFKAAILPRKKYSEQETRLHRYYANISKLRSSGKYDLAGLHRIYRKIQSDAHVDWLIRFEILELLQLKKLKADWKPEIIEEIRLLSAKTPDVAKFVESSFHLIGVKN